MPYCKPVVENYLFKKVIKKKKTIKIIYFNKIGDVLNLIYNKRYESKNNLFIEK